MTPDKPIKEHEYFQSEPRPPFPKQILSPPGKEYQMDPAPRFEAPLYLGATKLAGKKALITGGDSGIGRAIAILYAREGADVGITYLPEEKVDAAITVEHITYEGQRGYSIQADLTSYKACEHVIDAFVRHFGGIDILVNNAGIQKHIDHVEDLSVEQWDLTFQTNISSCFYLTKAALPHMKAGATIINTGSINGLEGNPKLIDYAATKGALHAYTKSLALALIDRGIRVNCVAPGPVWTPLNPAEQNSEAIRHFGEGVPYRRPAQPEEIAPAFVFLASETDSSYMTGEVLALLGGHTRAG